MGLQYSNTFNTILPSGWKRFTISAFGMSSCFVAPNEKQVQLIHEFNTKYIREPWVVKHKSLEGHKRFSHMLLITSISSSTFNDKMEVPAVMCAAMRM